MVTVNPTTPVGEQDVKPTPTGRIVVDFLRGKFPAYVETGLNLPSFSANQVGYDLGAGVWAAFRRPVRGGDIAGRRRAFPGCLRALTSCANILTTKWPHADIKSAASTRDRYRNWRPCECTQ